MRALTALTPAFFVICALLAVAGVRKTVAPRATTQSIAFVGVSLGTVVVRTVGCGEVALGVGAAVWPTRLTAALVAVAYAMFWGFVLLLLVRNPGRSVDCGCFGGAEHGAGWLHVALNGLACAAAAACAAIGAHGIGWVLGRAPLTVLSLLVGVVAASYAAYLAYTVVPHAWSSYGAGAAQ